MDKHLIICLHGMGEYDSDWGEGDVKEPLKKAYNQYESLKEIGDFDQRFEFKYINYNPAFKQVIERKREVLNQLGNLSEAAENALAGFGKVGSKLMQLYKTEDNDDEDFWTTHSGDVFLYLVDPIIRADVNSHIYAKLSEYMTEFINDTRGIAHVSIIAHSLGTAVITDSLQRLYNDPVIRFRANYGKLKILMTVANVANLASTISGGNVYASGVRPGFGTLNGVCSHYINTWHELDIFTLYKRFRPDMDDWDDYGNLSRLSGHIYIEKPIAAKDTQEKNTHSLNHYLSHPDVHLCFFNYLEETGFNKPIVTSEERQKALKAWRADTLLEKLKTKLAQFQDQLQGDVDSLEDAFEDIFDKGSELDIDVFKALADKLKTVGEGAEDNLKKLVEDLEEIIKKFWEE